MATMGTTATPSRAEAPAGRTVPALGQASLLRCWGLLVAEFQAGRLWGQEDDSSHKAQLSGGHTLIRIQGLVMSCRHL